MHDEREDRRVRRTRRLLREALLALIPEKGYDRVTVQDVLDRADIGRATFYAHFRDKDDLLLSGLDQLRDSLREQLAILARGSSGVAHEPTDLMRVLFEHAADNRPLYRALVGKRGGGLIFQRAHEELATLLREHFDDMVEQHQWKPAMPPELVIQYLVSALLGLLTWWLDNQRQHSPAEMSHAFQQLASSGIGAVFDTGSVRGA